MFTGIIEQTGTVASLTRDRQAAARLTIQTPLAAQLKLGGSICVSGVCLTAVAITRSSFSADLLEETLTRSTLSDFFPGEVVNLELPTPAGAPLGGHIVQGHVDAVGVITKLEHESGAASSLTWRVAVTVPQELRRYLAQKGSITIDGISLTVAAVSASGCEVAIIPHTYEQTNIKTLKAGDRVNIEIDPLAKYAEQLLAARERKSIITLEMLVANGY
ncbi:MAG: riboflavin synthase [Acidobacteriaceae bacterium]